MLEGSGALPPMEVQQEQLLLASIALLDRSYIACQDLSRTTCPTVVMFVETYHEVSSSRQAGKASSHLIIRK